MTAWRGNAPRPRGLDRKATPSLRRQPRNEIPILIVAGHDCLLHNLMQRKRRLAARALWPMGDTEEDSASRQEMLRQDGGAGAGGDPVDAAMRGMFARDGLPPPRRESDGSIVVV